MSTKMLGDEILDSPSNGAHAAPDVRSSRGPNQSALLFLAFSVDLEEIMESRDDTSHINTVHSRFLRSEREQVVAACF